MNRSFHYGLLVGLTFLSGTLPARSADTSDGIRHYLSAMDSGLVRLEGHRILTTEILRPFYAERDYQPAWTNPERVREMLELANSAYQHGMLPSDFFDHSLNRLSANPGTDLASLDLLLSEALVRYAYNRRYGKINPQSIDKDINFKRQLQAGSEPHVTLQQALDEGNLRGIIDRHTDHGPWYMTLKAELERLHAVAVQGGWSTVSEGPTLHPGDSSPRVPEVRQRLAAQGRPGRNLDNGSSLYDEDLASAVRTFQQDHGLDVDAVIGPASLRAMNVDVDGRIDQLRLSLERLRWVSSDVEDKDDFVAVNIAGYRVYVIQDGQLAWTSRAMVGKPYRQTPVFSGAMQYIEFNPTWTVPPGIHRNDILPAIKRDVSYLADKNMTVLDHQGNVIDPLGVDWQSYGRSAPYIFRQEPGPWNALGQVKFIFPNPHFVFLHDTNHRELFDQPQRAFSSGCIRVQDPMDLAEVLLQKESGWGRSAIDSTVDSKATRRVNFKNRIPVYILYLTAALDLDGSVLFLNDPYERDGRLLAALNAPMSIILPGNAAR